MERNAPCRCHTARSFPLTPPAWWSRCLALRMRGASASANSTGPRSRDCMTRWTPSWPTAPDVYSPTEAVCSSPPGQSYITLHRPYIPRYRPYIPTRSAVHCSKTADPSGTKKAPRRRGVLRRTRRGRDVACACERAAGRPPGYRTLPAQGRTLRPKPPCAETTALPTSRQEGCLAGKASSRLPTAATTLHASGPPGASSNEQRSVRSAARSGNTHRIGFAVPAAASAPPRARWRPMSMTARRAGLAGSCRSAMANGRSGAPAAAFRVLPTYGGARRTAGFDRNLDAAVMTHGRLDAPNGAQH